jgi:hypothetical protein
MVYGIFLGIALQGVREFRVRCLMNCVKEKFELFEVIAGQSPACLRMMQRLQKLTALLLPWSELKDKYGGGGGGGLQT